MKINSNKFRNIQKIDEHTLYAELKLSEAEVSSNNIRSLQNKELREEDLKIIKATLVPSIKALGLAQLPSCDSEGKIFVGSRRMEAYKEAKEIWIPVIVKDLPRIMEKAQSWAENRARKETDELTEARFLKERFIDEEKMTGRELEELLKVPHTYIADRLKVLETLGGSTGTIESDRGLTREQEKRAITYQKARVLSRDWVPKKTREKLVKQIKSKGMSHEEVQRELGKGKVVQTIIDQEEKPEVKAQLEKEFGGDKAFEVTPDAVLEKQRTLKGLAPILVDKEVLVDEFETDAEKVEVTIHPNVMQRILQYFRKKKGNYKGYKVIVEGEVAKSEE